MGKAWEAERTAFREGEPRRVREGQAGAFTMRTRKLETVSRQGFHMYPPCKPGVMRGVPLVCEKAGQRV